MPPSPLLIETRVSLNEPALRARRVEDQAVFMRAHPFEDVLSDSRSGTLW